MIALRGTVAAESIKSGRINSNRNVVFSTIAQSTIPT